MYVCLKKIFKYIMSHLSFFCICIFLYMYFSYCTFVVHIKISNFFLCENILYFWARSSVAHKCLNISNVDGKGLIKYIKWRNTVRPTVNTPRRPLLVSCDTRNRDSVDSKGEGIRQAKHGPSIAEFWFLETAIRALVIHESRDEQRHR